MPVKTNDDWVVVNGPLTKRDLTRLSKLHASTGIAISHVEMPAFDFLEGWDNLRTLHLYSCKTDLTWLLRFKKLEKVFINTIRSKTPDLSPLGSLKQLRELGFGYIPHLEAVPDLSACKKLRCLQIFNCKRLTDLCEVLRIAKLESFSIVETPQQPSDLIDIMAMPSLKMISGAFGSKKLDDEFRRLMAAHNLTYG